MSARPRTDLSAPDEATAPRWRPLVMAAVATAISFAILTGLGVWQLQRLAWKEGVIAQIEERAYGPPGAILPEADWPAFDPAREEYRRVRVTGALLHEAELRVHGLSPGGTRGQPIQGFFLMTPLRLEDGAIVVVNRGFVPTELVEEAARPEGVATLEGLVRAPEPRNAFTPPDEPAARRAFVREPAAVAAAAGLDRVAPFYVDALPAEGGPAWPRGGASVLRPPNNHLVYALTWFGLAGALAAVFAAFAWRWLRR